MLVKFWREGKMLQDMRDAMIITLYKNKGAITTVNKTRSDCNNHRRISLFGIAGKAFAQVILPRLQKFFKRVYLSRNVDYISTLYH